MFAAIPGESERATDPAVTPGEEGRTLESRVLGNLASPVRRGESGNLHRARRPAPTQRAAWAGRTHHPTANPHTGACPVSARPAAEAVPALPVAVCPAPLLAR